MKIFGIEITLDDWQGLGRITREIYLRLRVPKNRKNRIGIAICIRTESKEEEDRVNNDIVHELVNTLDRSGLSQVFYIIHFPSQVANKVVSMETADDYLVRSRGHMMIFGSMAKRKISDEKNFVFRLHGIVKHRPIPIAQSKKFAEEFTSVLPSKIVFPEGDELLGFELTSKSVGLVTKYVISIALHIGLDYFTCLKLLESLAEELEQQTDNIENPVVEKFRERIPLRVEEVLSSIVAAYYSAFAATRDKRYVTESKQYLDKLDQLSPDNYIGILGRAIYFFFDSNVDAAIAEYKKASTIKDSAWRYGLGFLLAYQGDLDSAWEQYKRAIRTPTQANILNDVEIFMSEVIEFEPQKKQLIFYRGLLNLKAKGDLELAKRDFESFLDLCESNELQQLRDLAEKYLMSIENI